MTGALAIAGWTTAAVAGFAAAAVRHSLAARMEAVARASHELRGPLTAARLGLELGLRPGRPSSARLRAIELELARATLALDDLSQASRGSLHRVRVPVHAREPVDAAQLLAESVEAWRGAAAARGLDVRMRWSGPAAVVLGDRLRLAQATGNLLANAIEHGGGSIQVHGRAERSRVRIEVLDGGAGLSAPVDELTRRGRRGNRSAAPRGRGLAIVSAVAAAHGGRLAAAPSEHGARLVLELPLAGG